MLSISAKSKSNKAKEKTDSHSSGGVSAQNYSCRLDPAASPAEFQASIKAAVFGVGLVEPNKSYRGQQTSES